LLSLIATVNATDCGTYIPTCLLTSDSSTCWNNFVSDQQSQCTLTETIEAYALVRVAGCSTCYFTATPTTCLEADTIFTTCQVLNTSICSCYADYVQKSASVCTSNDDKITQWTTCILAKLGCSNLDCTLDCQLLDSLIPDTRLTFQTCCNTTTDKCGCYTAAVSKIGTFTGCDTAVSLKLETCIQSQLDCTSMQGTQECKATDVALSIATINQLYEQAPDKFRALWNAGLASVGISITTVTQASDGNSITLTFTITYTGDINDAISSLKEQLVATIGLRDQDLQGKEISSSKRGVLSTSTVQITGNPNSSSGASGLTFVILPLVALISSIHYYF